MNDDDDRADEEPAHEFDVWLSWRGAGRSRWSTARIWAIVAVLVFAGIDVGLVAVAVYLAGSR